MSAPAFAQNYSPWKPVTSYRPPANVQDIVIKQSLPSFAWYIQRIEGAPKQDWFGGTSEIVNLDEYAVRVTKVPTVDGKMLNAPALLEYVRKNLSRFIDPANGKVAPITSGDAAMWEAGIPGAVMMFSVTIAGLPLNNPHVVLGVQEPAYWRFSTIMAGERLVQVPPTAAHPVSGVREFGHRTASGDFELYTRGADRVTTGYALTPKAVLDGGDAMWKGFQKRVADFVRANGGTATVVAPVVHRPKWSDVKATIHSPTVPWQ